MLSNHVSDFFCKNESRSTKIDRTYKDFQTIIVPVAKACLANAFLRFANVPKTHYDLLKILMLFDHSGTYFAKVASK